MQSKAVFIVGAGACSALGGLWLWWRWRKYRVFLKPVFDEDGVPVERMIPPKDVLFGKVEGENRGPCPMDPALKRKDDLYWLRDDTRSNPKVLAHLNRENAYFEHKFRPLRRLHTKIYREFVSHVKETDEEVPYPWGNYIYYTRTVKGLSYPIHCRRLTDTKEKASAEEVVLDVNLLSKGKKYCDVHSVEPSPDHQLIGFTVDHTGYETFEIKIKDMATGRLVPLGVDESAGQMVWGSSNSEFFYTTMDSEHRPYKVWKHVLGEDQSKDVCLFTEDDELFWIDIDKTCSGRFLIVESCSPTTSEIHVLDLQDSKATLSVVQPRVKDHRYSVEHWGEHFYIITNMDKCINSKLVKTKISSPSRDHWVEVLPYEKSTKLDYLVCFADHVVINGRSNGLKMCKIMDMRTGAVHDLHFDEECYDMYPKKNKQFDSKLFRFGYSSLVTPHSTFEYDMTTRKKTMLKEQEVPGYDRSMYRTARIMTQARDGEQVAVSLVFHKDCAWAKSRSPSPMMLYGYGSYGICIDPSFDSKTISFLDRGMIYAIAHIRGGGEMGRQWYEEQGKFLTKMNTFTDFCDCAEHLIKLGMTTSSRLAISGRSAGGLLMGAVMNLRPDLFRVVVAGVPFVDIMATMSDPSIPLTITEWEEWGNPNERRFFDYMLSYSPVDNIRDAHYPALLVTAGLNDPRVPYWEPAKWVARLREKNKSKKPMLLRTDMSSGHFAASDRYRLMAERSIEFAFVVDQLECRELLNLTPSE